MPASRILPTTQTLTWDRTGSIPNVSTLSISILDPDVLYVQYSINFENTNAEWLYAPGVEGSYLDHNGASALLDLDLKNLDLLPAGNYKATVIIELSNAEAYVRTMTSVVNLILTGNPPNQITTDKQNYNVLFIRETNEFSGETEIEIINNLDNESLTFESLGTLFKEGNLVNDFVLEEDPTFPFLTNAELPLSGTHVVNCRLKKGTQNIYSFTVTFTVIENDEIIADPTAFEFLLRKGFNETKTAVLNITNPLNHAFTITKPSWINLSASSGSSSATINLETANSDTLTVGELNGLITISYDSKTIEIPVKVTVISFIDINTTDHNFCLDKVILKVVKMNETARFVRVTLKMKFKTAEEESEAESVYQIPYFQDKVKTDIGEKIQNYFPVFKDHLFETDENIFDNKLIYKAASVQLIVEELDINYTILKSVTLDDLDFYAGHKPKLFPLFTNFSTRRKYSASVYFFSYLSDEITPGEFTAEPVNGNPTLPKEVHAVMLKEGGILNNNYLKNNLDVDLIPFPNVESQVVLQWLNNNLVPEWMILSGSYKLNDDFAHTTDDFQINGQKYETTEKQKLTISTGFILKEESGLIKEIIKSKVSFIKLEGEIYKAFCTTQKLVELESQKNLINYELEFEIVK